MAELRSALMNHRNAVVVAPPGAGKTTMVPLRLLGEPWVGGDRIIMLEPRRLAARAAAARMAGLLDERVGETVGFQTRDERRIGPDTRIEVLTEGVLTKRLQQDPSLTGVALVIFDEVHERNLPTDIGLAFLLDAIAKWQSPTRIVAMSATAQSEMFAQALATDDHPAPVITSHGRQHPVEITHVPRARDTRIEEAVADAVIMALGENDGDILVFLPGIAEIDRTRTLLGKRLTPDIDVVRLAGALPFDEQDAALRASAVGNRRVVLSTDIAETSLTVEGVHIVIDAGLARVPRFNPRTGMIEIVTITSSRASADQRSGRAGRVRPGAAYRLWSKLEDGTRLEHLPAEMTQTDLTGFALEVAAWGTPIGELRFLDAPPQKNLRLALDTLRLLRLIDDDARPTPLGREALALPLHPRLATMVARHRDGPAEAWIACIVAALLDGRDIMRGRPDETPCDLALRVKLIARLTTDDRADNGALRRVADQARDIARRASIRADVALTEDMIDVMTGPLVLSAYPDRLAMRRSSPGQFVMRAGGAVLCDTTDSIARESFIVAADVSAQRNTSRVRRGAAIDLDHIAPILGDDVEVESWLTWDKDRDDLVMRVVRKVGNMRIDERSLAPTPGPDTTAALLERVRATNLGALAGGDGRTFRQRIEFMRHHQGQMWPDVSTKHLLATLDQWLEPHLVGATGRHDLERIDVTMVISTSLGWDQATALEHLAPPMFDPPRGRSVPINYADPEAPMISIRVQHLFGLNTHPCVLDGLVPVRVQLLSPADRPIQVTSDLPGFWTGSWRDVRRDMAGRYPKHDWPLDPSL